MTHGVFLFLTTFLASGVEAVEALTIVLAVGVVRGWRSPLIGVGVAALVLAVIVAVLGPALRLIPIDTLRLVVGALLLVFGLQWLRKAILRSSGYKALHDEGAAFKEEQELAASASTEERAGMDWYSFTVAFKGVLLEGLEVVFIVVTFGAAQGRLPLAAAAAAAAVLVVAGFGLLVRAPLERVPENTIKFAVGLAADELRGLLGRRGGGRELARRGSRDPRDPRVPRARLRGARPAAPPRACRGAPGGGRRVSHIRRFAAFWWDFIVGDDWVVAAGVAVGLGLSAFLADHDVAAWWVLPVTVVLVLVVSLRRATRNSS